MKQIAPLHSLEINYLLDELNKLHIDISKLDPASAQFIKSIRKRDCVSNQLMQQHLSHWFEIIDDRAWGLSVGQRVTVDDYGTFGHAFLSCKNLHAAYGMLATHRPVLRTIHEIRHSLDAGEFRFALKEMKASGSVARFFIEAWASSHHRTIKMLLGQNKHFKSICFAYPEPASASLYRDLFECPVTFDEEETCFTLDEVDLHIPFTLYNDDVRTFCERQCQLMMTRMSAGPEVVDRARQAVLMNPGWFPSCDELARALNYSTRTFRRRLKAEGSSYREILESVRKELAHSYLSSTDLTIEMISDRLGYRESNSFYKAFRRWHGVSPKSFASHAS